MPEDYRCFSVDIGVIEPHNEQYQRFMDVLLHSGRRWETVTLSRQGRPATPEFLSILQAVLSKTDTVYLMDCIVDDASFECLNSGLVMKEGLRGVEFWTYRYVLVTEAQMSMLSQGLSVTTTLETLGLPADLTNPGVVQHLIAGLSANTSLKCLKSCWCRYQRDTLSSVIAALHSHPNLSRLMLYTDELWVPQVQESLQTLLSRDDCKLEDIDLMVQTDSTSSRFSLPMFENPNTPLKSLHLCNLGIENSSLRTMLPSCMCLVELDLCGNSISDLEPLDSLLLGESCYLERLTLEENPITVNSARIFAQKLPKMKLLRRLDLRDSPFLDDPEFLEEFIDYANQNTSMERLQIFTSTQDEDAALRPKLMYGPCLNRAGRRYVGHNPGVLPLNLLPTVLVRSRRIYYYDPFTSPKKPIERLDGLDATFWLLRENKTFHLFDP